MTFVTALIAVGLSISFAVPSAFAATARQLREEAEERMDEARLLRQAAAGCRAKLQSRELTSCQVEVEFQRGRLVSISEAESLAGDLNRQARGLCDRVKGQLNQDIEVMRRQQRSIEQGVGDLSEWTKKNDEAQKAALKTASSFLVDSISGKLGEIGESKLAALEKEFKKRAPRGETWNRKIQKVQQFRSAKARLSGAVDGIGVAEFSGSASDAWLALREWAAKSGREGEIMDAVLADFQKDPELKQILKENGLTMASTGLKQILAPLLSSSLTLGEFVVNYAYDATAWTASRNRIEQQVLLRDQELRAVNALKAQIERTTDELNTCRRSVN